MGASKPPSSTYRRVFPASFRAFVKFGTYHGRSRWQAFRIPTEWRIQSAAAARGARSNPEARVTTVTSPGIVALSHCVTPDVIGPGRCRVIFLFFPPVLKSLAHWEDHGLDTGTRRECIYAPKANFKRSLCDSYPWLFGMVAEFSRDRHPKRWARHRRRTRCSLSVGPPCRTRGGPYALCRARDLPAC